MFTYEMVSGHLYLHENESGDVVDATVFCSDWCARSWCAETGHEYRGWNGCHEMDGPQWCASCGEKL